MKIMNILQINMYWCSYKMCTAPLQGDYKKVLYFLCPYTYEKMSCAFCFLNGGGRDNRLPVASVCWIISKYSCEIYEEK